MDPKEMLIRDRLHNPPEYPHWSLAIENWPADRWDAMTTAPSRGWPILEVRGREADGRIVEPMHYACGDGDGLMPPFDGWFVPYNPVTKEGGFYGVRPVEWQPLAALQASAAKT